MHAVPLSTVAILVPVVLVLVVVAGVAVGPSPVVVLGLPVRPVDGGCADRVWVTLTVITDAGELSHAEAVVACEGREVRHALVAGPNRVLVDTAGEHTLAWVVTTRRGATSSGSTQIEVRQVPEQGRVRLRHQVRLAA